MLFKTSPQVFNAVTACAAKDNVRYYLNTFYVDTDNKRIVATNGHILAFAPLIRVETGDVDAEPDKSQFRRGFLFNSLGCAISNKGEEVYIDCNRSLLTYHTSQEQTTTLGLEKCDGIFPDYDKVKYADETKAVDRISFQPEYVAKMFKWAGLEHSKAIFSFNGQLDAIGVRLGSKELSEVHVSLMPCRIRRGE